MHVEGALGFVTIIVNCKVNCWVGSSHNTCMHAIALLIRVDLVQLPRIWVIWVCPQYHALMHSIIYDIVQLLGLGVCY